MRDVELLDHGDEADDRRILQAKVQELLQGDDVGVLRRLALLRLGPDRREKVLAVDIKKNDVD